MSAGVTSSDLLYYCLFVSFFPPLIAGPIVHGKEIIPQFENAALAPRTIDIALGLSIFAIGLFKKCILADLSAQWADPVFAAAGTGHASVTFVDAWQGALAYTFQLYFDFSGYSDMAIGLARLFGFTLPLNFFSPYKATNIVDFWRRWHITLSRFLRDYVYIPLGGNRNGHMRRYINLLATMLIGGLWHGASWTFVIWGGIHGTMLLINHGWRHLRGSLGVPTGNDGVILRLAGWALTFLAVTSAWVLFRADTLKSAGTILSAMYGLDGHAVREPLAAYGLAQYHLILNLQPSKSSGLWLLLVALVTFALPNVYELFRRYRPALVEHQFRRPPIAEILNWRPSWIWASALSLAILLSMLRMRELSPFIYFQF
jgi:alginate O-acetyltransferase complex protein AlgI